MSDPFIGEIRIFSFPFAPKDWALCNGQTLSIQSNTALFSLIGTTYGGNGQTTFALPNLQSRVPVHQGQGPGLSLYGMGQVFGVESVTLTQTQMPEHNHLVLCNTGGGNQASPGGGYPAVESTGTSLDYNNAPTNGSTLHPNTITPAGNSQPHTNIQPSLCVSYCICLAGIYPSRN